MLVGLGSGIKTAKHERVVVTGVVHENSDEARGAFPRFAARYPMPLSGEGRLTLDVPRAAREKIAAIICDSVFGIHGINGVLD